MTSVTPLSRTSRRWRLAVAASVVVLLLAGTAWGQDDAFPFGPFRMYATKQRLDGASNWYRVEGVSAEGAVEDIPVSRFGLRRAELEGQMDRFRSDPALLGALVTVYERRQPQGAPLVEIRIVKHVQPVRGGVPSGEPTQRVVVTWRR
ncbi:MAG: hypothetical protein ACT4OV_08370 [Microthrixaceae bacterium]